jgi:tetraacyldisaccharide-1-P 4'-kinase
LTTEKDYVKLATFKIQRLFSIGIEIKFVEGEKFFIKILNKQLKIN